MRLQDTIALFGPQVTRWTQESLLTLQSALLLDPNLKFIKEALIDLPSIWPIIAKGLDITSPGRESLQQLSDFANGKKIVDEKSLNNVHLAPLTVVDHAVQLVHMAEKIDFGTNSKNEPLKLPNFRGAQGFCIGFLSAAVISASSNWAEFELNTSNALRLAACIGLIIDNDNAPHDGATAVSVRWKTDSDRTYLDASLDLIPNAYISCITDVKTVTITLPSRDEKSFCSRLSSQVGIATSHIGLNGRFHNPRHAHSAQLLKKLCGVKQSFQLPEAERLCLPVRSTMDAEIIHTGSLHDVAIELILCKRAHWFQTVKATLAAETSGGKGTECLPVGKDSFVPRSLSSKANQGLRNGASLGNDEIAVVGMACRFPQADSLEEFWQLISSGATALGKVPLDRFNPAEIRRDPKLLDWWGNFLKSPEVFDHRFFGISGREAKSMDPQQRLALQVAYEALESSGYCSLPSEAQATDIGCYLGVGAVDYEDNVASEDANAFSATGMLRAFISGRISHYFGWSGPSITFDTACSSSAVAIHSACKALLAGECSMALAGGVNVITSPNLYQNLMAGNFLNPTGSSKAFDASANGYCRGEGAGLLLLKPLSKATADKDFIVGVISGSSVNQNSNCSSITVPDSNSQGELYKKALSHGGIQPKDVTFVEAHGTGTPVGDPIEYESVRTTFGGTERSEELYIGSVKDSIGHCEAASGVAGVIKALLMMQHGIIPKQANFQTLNPRIKSSPLDRITVPMKNRPWNASRRIALVNNYGAAGSNAAIVIRENDKASRSKQDRNSTVHFETSATYPVLLCARSASSLRRYMSELKSYVPEDLSSLGSFAYNIYQRQNPSFEFRAAFAISNQKDLLTKLEENGKESSPVAKRSQDYPVVLCFGGQTGWNVNLSRDLYDDCVLLRKYLDDCDAKCKNLGLPSIFPGIFQDEPIDDLVSLHCMLFSLQFSTAKCWLESGLKVDVLIGHSFGQLTALCIADSISFQDALRLISGRARLVQEEWGQERGAMLSVECDRQDLEAMVDLVNSQNGFQVDFACYNGKRSFVLAGDTISIEKVEEACRSDASRRFRMTRLKNSHAYHSYLTHGILPELERLAKSIEIRKPSISVETCSKDGTWLQFDAENIVKHTRQPVYFFEAVERIAGRLPSAIWLEAGSGTPIINMTRRILDSQADSNVLVPIELGPRDASRSLANAASQLWMAGSNTQYWLFQRSQQSQYSRCDLPPYQFEKAQHWIQYKPSVETKPSEAGRIGSSRKSNLVSLMKHDISGETIFSVDTSNTIFKLAARGHAVAGQSLCPASMYIELAARCAGEILGDVTGRVPEVEDLTMSAPLGLSVDVNVFLRLSKSVEGWNFAVMSESQAGFGATEHAKGRISLTPLENPLLISQMKLLKQLSRYSRTDEILASPFATGISGSMVYKVFSDVVEYASYYRGVSSLCGLENESVGQVINPDWKFGLDPGVCDPIALDNFLQVAGIHVNCLSDRKGEEVFMCTAVEKVVFSKFFLEERSNSRSWTVYSRYEKLGKNITNNIFVFDAVSKSLVVCIIGAIFRSVPFKSVVKSLAKLNAVNGAAGAEKTTVSPADSTYVSGTSSPPLGENAKQYNLEDSLPGLLSPLPNRLQGVVTGQANSSQLIQKVREMFAEIIEIPLEEVETTSTLDDLGIDSLLVTEVQGEIQKRFNVNITPAEFLELDDVLSVCRRIRPDSAEQPHEPINGDVKQFSGSDLFNEPTYAPQEHRTTNKRAFDESLAVISHDSFSKVKGTYDVQAKTTGFTNFCTEAFPLQSELVVRYVVEAFASLGCDLSTMKAGDEVPLISHIPVHKKVVPQLYAILQTAELITKESGVYLRSSMTIPRVSSSVLHTEMLKKFPQHTSETNLLHTTGARLADCISGSADPVGLIFRDSVARALLSDVYLNAPMFKAGTMILARYLTEVLEKIGGRREIKILELGAGTGGTSSYLLEALTKENHSNFTYTFTDLSSSLVMQAKKKFVKYPFMHYTVLDIEKNPEPQFLGQYDIIISTNCIHATKDLILSTTNIRKMLRPDGILCLCELTRNLFWFDLVFGLLEGWWLFNDGREHVLANETRWEHCLQAAGFQWVDWSDSPSQESDILRVITASPAKVAADDKQQVLETLVFKEVDGLELHADIYYPEESIGSKKLPVALMIHGGGHIMLSRKDVRPEQTTMLLNNGFLPISIDYRLCPETTILEGPMVDVVDAMAWIRTVLPKLQLSRRDIVVDGEKVVSVGWSTGGTLAMSLAWTSVSRGIKPPEAILAFYCPTDYEDPFWTRPNIPAGTENQSSSFKLDDIWEAVYDQPITSYNVPSTKRALGGWLSPSDARSRLAIHMNWHGRTLQILLNGLDKSRSREEQENQSVDIGDVAAISPLAHIRSGEYSTPTFIIHPRQDDLIPWQQAQRTYEALRVQEIETDLRIVEDGPHLFDLYREYGTNEASKSAVRDGYSFLCSHVGL